MTKNSVTISPEIAQRIREKEAEHARMIAEMEAEHARAIRALEEEAGQRAAQLEADYQSKGRTYVKFIEELGELFDVPRPELVERRHKKTGEVVRTRGDKVQMVDPDRTGEKRVEKLRRAIREATSEPTPREEARAEEPDRATVQEASVTPPTHHEQRGGEVANSVMNGSSFMQS